MCKITDFEFDEALECIRPHAPKCAETIDKYVEQLRRDKEELKNLIELANSIRVRVVAQSAKG